MSRSAIFDRIRIIPRPDDFLDRNVGSSGEIFFDQQANTLRLYNGKSTGGFSILTAGNLTQQLSSNGVAVLERTVTVGVDSVAGQSTGVFYIDGVERPGTLNLVRGYTYVFDQSDNPLLVEISYGFNKNVYYPCPGYWDDNLNWIEGFFKPEDFMIEDIVNTL